MASFAKLMANAREAKGCVNHLHPFVPCGEASKPGRAIIDKLAFAIPPLLVPEFVIFAMAFVSVGIDVSVCSLTTGSAHISTC